MGTCKTCKYWNHKNTDTYIIKPDFQLGRCNNEKLGPMVKDGLIADCMDCDCAGIETGPDFGCIHHEEIK